MKCAHQGCSCEVEAGREYCSDHCREHNAGAAHAPHTCGCGHAACALIGQ